MPGAEMGEQWPAERREEEREVVADSSFKTKRDFFYLLRSLDGNQLNAFREIVSWIVEQDGDLSDLERRSVGIADESARALPDAHMLVLTLASAAALAHTPSLQTWAKINAFKFHSWQLENWLGEAMAAYAELHPWARNAYASLAKDAFTALKDFSLQSKSDRSNDERENVWAHWGERQDKLEEIWWGLRGWSGFMIYEEELPLFRVFYALEPDEFIRTISRSSNPYLVSAFLFVTGIGGFYPQFAEWQRIIAEAPAAFENGGKWNGSVLIPLLLVDARNQLLQVGQYVRSSEITPDELEGAEKEITITAELIASTVATRRDASAIFSRWSSWLVRQILGRTATEIADVKSSGFADSALLNAIGSQLENRTLPTKSSDDAPLWEAWCCRCALAYFAYNGDIAAPEWEDFVNEWHLSPEDWVGEKGYLLREHASLICILNKEAPGIAANLLAFPIVQCVHPVEAWIGLWNGSITLREIVEFGDANAAEDGHSARGEAGRLLLLLFRIGLAVFDQLAALSSDNNSAGARSLAGLFESLHAATSEMREIDDTLNHEEWFVAVQHLAVRRIIWKPSLRNESASANFKIFKTGDTPTVSEIFSELKGDVVELVPVIQSLLLNGLNVSSIKDHLNAASIDLLEVVRSIRALNQYHPRKYPIDEAQLQKLEAC